MLLGYVPKTGGVYGPDFFAMALDELRSMNFLTGKVRVEDRMRLPRIDRSMELFYTLEENSKFPAKDAYDEAIGTNLRLCRCLRLDPMMG